MLTTVKELQTKNIEDIIADQNTQHQDIWDSQNCPQGYQWRHWIRKNHTAYEVEPTRSFMFNY